MSSEPIILASNSAAPEAARQLASLCNRFEGLELKLSFDAPAQSPHENNRFLCYSGDALVGFCSLEGEEVCGMVHPAYRRRGIGSALLQAAVNEYKQRVMSDALIICEAASSSGRAFVTHTGGVLTFSEHHMERDTANVDRVETPDEGPEFRLSISEVGRNDTGLPAVARLIAASFGGSEEAAAARIRDDIEHFGDVYYIARLQDRPISTLKIASQGRKAGIYAFTVAPEYRGRGFGRQTMIRVMKMLADRDYTAFSLEVETTNIPAISLYKSLGFRETTTYGYYKIEF